MKRIVVFIAALLVLQCSYAQKANTAKKRIIQVFEISCDIKETFGDIVIEKEDTITRTYYDKQGRIVYEVLQYNNPTLSGNEMGMEYGDIESAMTHDMNYSKTPSNNYARCYRYNNNQLESIYTFTSQGILTQVKKFTYDKYGVSVEDVYDAKNNLIGKTRNNRSNEGKKIVNIEYYKDGTEKNKVYYELNAVGDTILCRSSYGSTHYTYDNAHRLVSNYVRKDFQRRYRYDNHGNCILKYPYRYSEWDKKWIMAFPRTKYEYEYDENGNWVTKKTIEVATDIESHVTQISKRDVYYAKSDEQDEKYLEYLENIFQKAYNNIGK